ncbi:uncharacterized protein LOC113295891 [Papaver somniferum]|uniref:uncharacterized protein LOC113295891 n=1 Tax=Papaver somniferum TaxID=3469 RepID=UPI000E7022F9|nr:uncharacterized protein LOC113295891 [Papaver somniferum]
MPKSINIERFYCMYEYSNYAKKKEQRNYIHQISKANNIPWNVLGDLNFHIIDKDVGTSSSTDGWVNNIVSSCGLEDIGFVGKDYTWTNNNMGTGSIRSKIDMALGNENWTLHFPRLLYLTQLGSNHSPIMLHTDVTLPKCLRPFKFFLTWLNDESFSLVIANAWKYSVNGSPVYQLVNKLHKTRRELSLWNKENFGNINQKVDNLHLELNKLHEQPSDPSTNNDIININNDLSKWHKIKTEFYQQNSRDHFIKDTDTNNKYFHTKVNRRKTRYNIDFIQDHNNNWLQSRDQISQHLTHHFKSISTSSNPVIDEGLYSMLPTIFSEFEYVSLTRIPLMKRYTLHSKLKSMENWSAPGPEGFQAGFYKSQWSIVGEDIISKVLVNIMKPLIDKIIFPFQAAYVSGRLKKRGETGWMALKLDMSKAFDSTTSLSVMLNGSLCEELSPSKGIRHGDPLSPYLFILAKEFLSRKLTSAQKGSTIKELLHNFSSQPGQVINFEKSAVHFIKKTKPEVAETLRQILGVKPMNSREKYLVYPLILGHSKQEYFKSIKENFENIFFTWSSITLSQAGTCIMIKHVLNSVLIYQMGTFKLPSKLLQQLTSIERKFFWGYNNNRGHNPTAWLNVCRPAEMGGLAFRDLEKLNLAMLTKIARRICNEPMSQVLSKLLLPDSSYWNVNLLNILFDVDTSLKVQALLIDNSKEDIMILMPAKDGKLLIKSAYKMLTFNDREVQVNGIAVNKKVQKALWGSKVAQRIKLFAWKCIRGINSTKCKRDTYNDSLDTNCDIFGCTEETMEHIIFER